MNLSHGWIKDLEYIIWDLDGTLYHINQDLYREIQIEVYQSIADLKNTSFNEAKEYYQQLYDKLHSNTLVLKAIGMNEEEAIQLFNETQLKHIEKDKKLIESMKKLNSFKHIVSTNSPQGYAHKKLKLIGFEDNFFNLIVGNLDTVGALKPDAAPYNYLLEHTQALPNKHLFVGDRYETDLATAKELGMHTALVYAEDGRADLEFSTVGDLVDYLLQQSTG